MCLLSDDCDYDYYGGYYGGGFGDPILGIGFGLSLPFPVPVPYGGIKRQNIILTYAFNKIL